MSLSKQVVTGTLVASGMVAIYLFVKKLRRMQLSMEAVPTVSIYKADLTGITIKVDVVLKNPTNGSFSIKFPFVKLLYKGATIGSSQVLNKDIVIPEYGEVKIERIMITIALLDTFSVAYSLIKALLNRKKEGQNQEPVKVGVTVITTAFAGGMSMPFNETYDLPIM
ncbi:MAG: hypothetical protein ABI675_15080 [Chitinophagaceae bacterium]